MQQLKMLQSAGLDESAFQELVNSVKGFVFDCDGVLYQGSKAIPGAANALFKLRHQGKVLRFLTNNASRSRKKVAEKLQSVGIEAHMQEVVCAPYSAAQYMNRIKHKLQDSGKTKILVFGPQALFEELELAGFTDLVNAAHSPLCQNVEGFSTADMQAMKGSLPSNLGSVVLGDDKTFNYPKLCLASFAVRAGCEFVVVCPEESVQVSGVDVPCCGSLAAAVEAASGSKGTNTGKPSQHMFDSLMGTLEGVSGPDLLMVGDRLDTDICFGASFGLKTLLVLSGETLLENVADQPVQPDFILKSVAELAA